MVRENYFLIRYIFNKHRSIQRERDKNMLGKVNCTHSLISKSRSSCMSVILKSRPDSAQTKSRMS